MGLSLSTIGIIFVCLFLILMFLRMPVGATMLICGFLGIAALRGWTPALSTVGTNFFRTGVSNDLIVIPVFILMGLLAAQGGVSKDAFTSMHKWVGHLPGGLGIATVGTCAVFGAISATQSASLTTMISVAYPEMKKYRYSDQLSLGCITSGCNLGLMIPPSIGFILYGFMTETSIGQLFLAGILPGILITILFWLQIYFQCRRNPTLAPRSDAASWKERFLAIKGLWGIAVVFILVMGGIYTGVFTPTEGASVGAAAVFIIGLAKRQLTWGNIRRSLFETARITGMIMFIICGAAVFSTFLTSSELTFRLAGIVAELSVNRFLILALVMLFYVIGGCILDIFPLLMVSLPVMFPIATALGIDPIHFGVLSVMGIMIGAITPPIAMNVFIAHGMIPEVPVTTIYRGLYPFLVTNVFCLIVLIIFPQISLILPTLAMPYR